MKNMTNGKIMAERDPDTCPSRELKEPPPEIAATLAVLEGKWKILILWQLARRSCRFNELKRAIPGVSQHMLTLHLRELEEEGILTRTGFAEVPPRVVYELTGHGRTLRPLMLALEKWGRSHLGRKTGARPVRSADNQRPAIK